MAEIAPAPTFRTRWGLQRPTLTLAPAAEEEVVDQVEDGPEHSRPDSAVVEQAKGMLMRHYGAGSYESMAALVRWAREADMTVSEIARLLVTGISQGRVRPAERGQVRWLEQRLRAELPDLTGSEEPAPAVRPEQETRTRRRESHGAPDIAVARRWRYASAVHAARALSTS